MDALLFFVFLDRRAFCGLPANRRCRYVHFKRPLLWAGQGKCPDSRYQRTCQILITGTIQASRAVDFGSFSYPL